MELKMDCINLELENIFKTDKLSYLSHGVKQEEGFNNGLEKWEIHKDTKHDKRRCQIKNWFYFVEQCGLFSSFCSFHVFSPSS